MVTVDKIEAINIEEDSTFNDHKGYYRKPIIELIKQIDHPDNHNIFMFISEEHTAQLNATQDNLFS